MFATQGEAKRFFVQKVAQQAEFEGLPLSPAEREMLSWSESDPELTLSAEQATALVDDLESQMSDEQYESKIAALLTRAYERDDASGGSSKDLWKDAYSKFNEGDHYIAVMLDHALGRRLRNGWSFWS
jgi:hypothetical protein